MLNPDELRRMHNALKVVLNTCIRDRRALTRKDADYLRADLEALQQHLDAAAKKREGAHE